MVNTDCDSRSITLEVEANEMEFADRRLCDNQQFQLISYHRRRLIAFIKTKERICSLLGLIWFRVSQWNVLTGQPLKAERHTGASSTSGPQVLRSWFHQLPLVSSSIAVMQSCIDIEMTYWMNRSLSALEGFRWRKWVNRKAMEAAILLSELMSLCSGWWVLTMVCSAVLMADPFRNWPLWH